jgi:ribosomal protein L7/L12
VTKWRVTARDVTDPIRIIRRIREVHHLGLREAMEILRMARGDGLVLPLVLPEDDALRVALTMEQAGATVDLVEVRS